MNEQSPLSNIDSLGLQVQPTIEQPLTNLNPEINSDSLSGKIGNIALAGYQIQPFKNELPNKKPAFDKRVENKFETPLPENVPVNTVSARDAEAIAQNLAYMQARKSEVAAQVEQLYASTKMPISESSVIFNGFRRKSRKRKPQPGEQNGFRLAA